MAWGFSLTRENYERFVAPWRRKTSLFFISSCRADTEEKRPVGEILVHDERGYAYLPKIVRKEIGLEGKGKIPFYLDANCVLLVREGATKQDILKGLDVLKDDLSLRMKEE